MARPGFVAYLFVVQCTTAVLCRCFYIRFVLPLILEGCTAYGDTENTYKGILNYDVYRGRYTISDPVYDKPYVPKYLRDQLSDADVKTLLAGGQVSADHVKDSFGEPMKNKVLYVNPRDNRTYSRFLSRQERSESAEASHQASQGADESQQGRGRKR